MSRKADNKWDSYRSVIRKLSSQLVREMHYLEVMTQERREAKRPVSKWQLEAQQAAQQATEAQCQERIRAVKAAVVSTFESIAAENSTDRVWPELGSADGDADDQSEVSVEDVQCSKCGQPDREGDDILLCDRKGCLRAYHQQCLDPPVPDEILLDSSSDWFCHTCQTLDDCLEYFGEKYGRDYDNYTELFTDDPPPSSAATTAAAASTAANVQLLLAGLADEDEEEERDEDYRPGRQKKRQRQRKQGGGGSGDDDDEDNEEDEDGSSVGIDSSNSDSLGGSESESGSGSDDSDSADSDEEGEGGTASDSSSEVADDELSGLLADQGGGYTGLAVPAMNGNTRSLRQRRMMDLGEGVVVPTAVTASMLARDAMLYCQARILALK
jgi:hypothetical protein